MRKFVSLIILFLLVFPSACFGAIAFENVGSGNINTSSPATISGFNAGTNATRVVSIVITGGSDVAVSGVTYGGVSMTQRQTLTNSVGINDFWFTLDSAPSGSNDFVVTGTNLNFNYYASSYSGGVYETSGSHSNNTNVTSDSVTLTVSANAWLIGYGRAAGDVTPSNSFSTRSSAVGNNVRYFDSNGALTAGSQTGGMTFSSSYNNIIVVAIKPPGTTVISNFGVLTLFGDW